jgi:hypothetical protein
MMTLNHVLRISRLLSYAPGIIHKWRLRYITIPHAPRNDQDFLSNILHELQDFWTFMFGHINYKEGVKVD